MIKAKLAMCSVDDLKLYGTNDNQLKGLVNTVKMVSDDIGIEFDLDKCAKATLKRGKNVLTGGTQLGRENVIQDLEPEATYTYTEEGDGTKYPKMKSKIQKEYKMRFKLVFMSELNGRNNIAAINTLAVTVVTYSCGV